MHSARQSRVQALSETLPYDQPLGQEGVAKVTLQGLKERDRKKEKIGLAINQKVNILSENLAEPSNKTNKPTQAHRVGFVVIQFLVQQMNNFFPLHSLCTLKEQFLCINTHRHSKVNICSASGKEIGTFIAQNKWPDAYCNKAV